MKQFVSLLAAALTSVSLLATTPTTWEVIDLQTGADNCTSVLPNAMAACAMTFGDYDNDGDMDIFFTGGQNAENMHVGLLQNDGTGHFTEVSLPSDFLALQQASAAWIDYNNDGNLDLIVVGTPDGATTYTYVMKNLGAAENYSFEEDIDNYLPGIYGEGNDNVVEHLIGIIDYNNDGWTDIVLSGNAGAKWDGTHERLTALFKNNHGIFEFDPIAQKATIGAEVFAQVNGGGVSVGDANNDGYMDLIIGGYDDDADKLPDADGVVKKGNGVSTLYLNDGNGGFTKSPMVFAAANLQGLTFFVDANNDGWNDIVELGRDLNYGWANSANVYMNNNGTFTRLDSCGLTGGQTVIGMADVNNDGFMDFVHSGWPTVNLAYGTGDATTPFLDTRFQDDEALAPLAARGGANSLVDMDGDLSADLHISGWSDLNGRWSDGIALNKTTVANAAPSAPSNVKVEQTATGYTLTWSAATDDHTPAAALRYNVAVKFADNTVGMVVPADLATGKQKVAGGIVAYINTLSYTFNGTENYTFYVQAIDQAGAASAFAQASASAVENITTEQISKVVEDGQIVIRKGNMKYNVLGQILK